MGCSLFLPPRQHSRLYARSNAVQCSPSDLCGIGSTGDRGSTDSPESHQKFAAKRALDILLLSDAEHTVLTAYDSWKPKTLFGKEFFGTQRDTFLIDPSGIIVAVWRRVSVKGHAEEVKKVLLEKQKSSGT